MYSLQKSYFKSNCQVKYKRIRLNTYQHKFIDTCYLLIQNFSQNRRQIVDNDIVRIHLMIF